ncbi:hypothetical protein CC1G_08883 [Coprinopsis cinerea okayama7|uniref:Uncharacterized protein n=1 Tax=Coprinopsis cinerea (strain Okayama-7 / 130 / ATCC MYA-4618 / FGSC 9003) TaxID=240176 RepID=A8P856_COPC7|nr:hypothetical protein CC1G_08883 [Coprinopsis cinerea okayama7\|eukprot:XP_001839504.1 hypothetical protein CC1G_08883 [Coprinopsis cinerea okayama7\
MRTTCVRKGKPPVRAEASSATSTNLDQYIRAGVAPVICRSESAEGSPKSGVQPLDISGATCREFSGAPIDHSVSGDIGWALNWRAIAKNATFFLPRPSRLTDGTRMASERYLEGTISTCRDLSTVRELNVRRPHPPESFFVFTDDLASLGIK